MLEEREEERRQQEIQDRVGSLQVLHAIKAKVEEPKPERKGRLYVEAKIDNKSARALIDTGATNHFLEVKEASRLGIKCEKTGGMVKAVNSEAKPISGVAKGVEVCLGKWKGKMDFSVIQMDDYPIVLGMEFLDSVNAVPIPCANTLAILGEKNGPCLVPLAREGSVKATQI